MLELRPLRQEDVTAMAELEDLCFPEDPWPAHLLASALEGEGVVALGLWLEGRLDAMVLGRFILDEGELHSMATRPERRGEGLALRLLDAFILQARQAAVEHIWLEVRLGNVAAHRLYQRRGFVVEGRRPRYYDDGEDALVMALRLSS